MRRHPLEHPIAQAGRRWLLSPSSSGEADLEFAYNGRVVRLSVPGDHIWPLAREHALARIYDREGWVQLSGTGRLLDCGAHVGTVALMAASHGAEVLAVEADPNNAALLHQNIARNALSDRVEVREAAVWSSTGTVPFGAAFDSGSGHVVETGDIQVRSCSLQDLLLEFQPTTLKLDIEGAEHAALLAVDNFGTVEAIVGEIHYPPEDRRTGAILSHLRAHGFDVDLVPEAYFYSRNMLRRAMANRRDLVGHARLKRMLRAYHLVRWLAPDTAGLPGLFARRRQPSTPSTVVQDTTVG